MSVKKKTVKKKVGKKSGRLHAIPVGEPETQSESATGHTQQHTKKKSLKKSDFDKRDKKLSPQRKAAGPGQRRRRKVPSVSPRSSESIENLVAPTPVKIKAGKSRKKS